MSLVTTVTLAPQVGSFWFAVKQLNLTETPTILGAASSEHALVDTAPRKSLQSNGWFRPLRADNPTTADIQPLSLSEHHAHLWATEGKIYIRDLDTPFGTFVNGTRIKEATEVKSGDVISLGSPIKRGDKTPTNITDDHLKPVIAQITVS